MKLHVVGIDLGKTVFHLVGLDSTGRVVIHKKCSRKQLLTFTANLEVGLIGMESCSGSHFLGRALREQGHEVRLMPAQYVKPYVQTNKSDYLDAEAIGEAVQRPRMRFVPIKTEEQLSASVYQDLWTKTASGFLYVLMKRTRTSQKTSRTSGSMVRTKYRPVLNKARG